MCERPSISASTRRASGTRASASIAATATIGEAFRTSGRSTVSTRASPASAKRAQRGRDQLFVVGLFDELQQLSEAGQHAVGSPQPTEREHRGVTHVRLFVRQGEGGRVRAELAARVAQTGERSAAHRLRPNWTRAATDRLRRRRRCPGPARARPFESRPRRGPPRPPPWRCERASEPRPGSA